MALRSKPQLCQEVPAKQARAQAAVGIEPRHCPSEAVPLGFAQSKVFPRPSSIPGKKKTEKWQLPSGPLWLLNSKRRLTELRTGKRVVGPRKRRQPPGYLRSPVAPGVCPGLRVKVQVNNPVPPNGNSPGLGKGCKPLVNISHSPSPPSQPCLISCL